MSISPQFNAWVFAKAELRRVVSDVRRRYMVDPIQHPAMPDTSILPLWQQARGDYALYTSGSTARYYTTDELPDVIRCQLAMIHAMYPTPLRISDLSRGSSMDDAVAVLAEGVPVGVWLSPNWYLLVIENSVLQQLVNPTQTV